MNKYRVDYRPNAFGKWLYVMEHARRKETDRFDVRIHQVTNLEDMKRQIVEINKAMETYERKTRGLK